MSADNITKADDVGVTSMLNYEQQQRYDQLHNIFGSEGAVREHLALIEADIAQHEEALGPIRDMRSELKQRLANIAQAKAEARAIGIPPVITVTKKAGSPA
jgi:hypothetical protein